jgi:hypothetical protein
MTTTIPSAGLMAAGPVFTEPSGWCWPVSWPRTPGPLVRRTCWIYASSPHGATCTTLLCSPRAAPTSRASPGPGNQGRAPSTVSRRLATIAGFYR